MDAKSSNPTSRILRHPVKSQVDGYRAVEVVTLGGCRKSYRVPRIFFAPCRKARRSAADPSQEARGEPARGERPVDSQPLQIGSDGRNLRLLPRHPGGCRLLPEASGTRAAGCPHHGEPKGDSHEAYLSTQQTPPEAQARVPPAGADASGTRHPQTPPQERTSTVGRVS